MDEKLRQIGPLGESENCVKVDISSTLSGKISIKNKNSPQLCPANVPIAIARNEY